jgi:hypothetical protein
MSQHYNNYIDAPAVGNATNVGLNVRKEIFNKDQINARQYEHWQTDGRAGIYDRIDKNKVPAYMDVMAGSSRTNHKDYRGAPLYNNNGGNKEVYNVEYFRGFDIKTDPLNVVRELRGAVVELKNDRGLIETDKLNERLRMGRY